MTRGCMILVLSAAGMAQAQQPAVPNASVTGVVKDKATGQPLPDYTVSTFTNSTWVGDTIVQSRDTRQVQSKTDASGRYRLADLAPGQYRILAGAGMPFSRTRRVTLAGHDLENVDFEISRPGTITGKVLDENKEPVPGVTVRLIAREYYLGNLGYFYRRGPTQTDDRGEYQIAGIEAGRAYLIVAEKVERNLPAISEAPLDPKLRRRIPVRTWYPNAPSADGAQAIVVGPGERRENVDLELKKSQSYCAEGAALGAAGTASVRFNIEPLQPSSGVSNSGGVFTVSPGGNTGPDGKFRVCDLYPGTYRLTAAEIPAGRQAVPNFGVLDFTIVDQDLKDVKVAASAGITLDGEVAWAGEPPATPPNVKVSVSLTPLLRAPFQGELGRGAGRYDIPGTFSWDGLLVDDYAVRTLITAPGFYVRDVAYGGRSVIHEPLRLGSAMRGAGLRVTVARDGGTISAKVADKDGNPVSDINVLVLPADAPSEGALSATFVRGATDQLGQYTSQTLPPGKYYVVATQDDVDYTPESIGRLWRARNHYQEVELAPSGAAQVSLQPGKIE
ncbi:MAG TPA: carboxypeptidase regulatory-like domain-containing protein [Bryobacteraceae bacterium]|nr:carboxypeptidase regulatory-like domain-containing protein [Bryobacteraceae bacterium]